MESILPALKVALDCGNFLENTYEQLENVGSPCCLSARQVLPRRWHFHTLI